MTADTLALVESPAQLLHLLEWCHAAQAADRTRLVVLAPTDLASVTQLRSMCDFAEEEGITAEWHFPRTSALAGLRMLADVRGDVARARRLIIGDPFSGMIQALLPFAGDAEIVIVDDGTATLEFAAQFLHGEPLWRWHGGIAPARMPLARFARSFLSRSHLSLFTVMGVTALPGSMVERHTYDWTRRRFGAPALLQGMDVIGSSLVETGVVETEPYLDAVADLAANGGSAGRYLAHRREEPDKLRRVSQRTGLRIVRPRVPLEIELRRGPVARQLASFPSSVGYTLPLVLAGSGSRIAVQRLPETMIRRSVGAGARSFLERLTQDMQAAASGFTPAVAATCA